MKIAFGAAVLATTLLAAPVLAQGVQDFRLNNMTGYTIDQVYVAASASSDWNDDILGQDVLNNGETVDITFHPHTNTCAWDLLVVYTDGTQAEWNGFDLCKVSTITIHYDRASGNTWANYQ